MLLISFHCHSILVISVILYIIRICLTEWDKTEWLQDFLKIPSHSKEQGQEWPKIQSHSCLIHSHELPLLLWLTARIFNPRQFGKHLKSIFKNKMWNE
jgi:hypothetical protein